MARARTFDLEISGAIADELIALAEPGLGKKLNKSFIALELSERKSPINKNAVSLKREGVSFMIFRDSVETEAKALAFKVKRDDDYPDRLIFTDYAQLAPSQIRKNAGFFANLTNLAKLRSADLQYKGNRNA